MRTLDPSLKLAIKNYFVAKYRDGTGAFIVPGEKTIVCKAIFDAARPLGWDITIVPGLIMCCLPNKDWIFFNKENKHIGFLVKKGTVNPLKVYMNRKKSK